MLIRKESEGGSELEFNRTLPKFNPISGVCRNQSTTQKPGSGENSGERD